MRKIVPAQYHLILWSPMDKEISNTNTSRSILLTEIVLKAPPITEFQYEYFEDNFANRNCSDSSLYRRISILILQG